MADYTQTIKEILDLGETVFPGSYPLYGDGTPDATIIKNSFEELFKQNYYYNEIGFENLDIFKQRFYAKMLLKNDYYKQLYETQLAALDVKFLLNKDLTETTTINSSATNTGTVKNTGTVSDLGNNEENINRDLSGTSGNTNTTDATITDNGTSTNNSTDTNKESRIDNGVTSAVINDTSLTAISEDTLSSNNTNTNTNTNNSTITDSGTNTSSEDSTITNSSTNTSTNDLTQTNNLENALNSTQTLVSQGNIGITSSAELLEKWRGVLISINELLINECSDLFMLVY